MAPVRVKFVCILGIILILSAFVSAAPPLIEPSNETCTTSTVFTLGTSNPIDFVTTTNSLFLSTNDNKIFSATAPSFSWSQSGSATGSTINSLAANPTTGILYYANGALAPNRIFESTTNGASWSEIGNFTGSRYYVKVLNNQLYRYASSPDRNVYIYDPVTMVWTQVFSHPASALAYDLSNYGSDILSIAKIGTTSYLYEDGVLKYTFPVGEEPIPNGLLNYYNSFVVGLNNYSIPVTGKVYFSSNQGTSWEEVLSLPGEQIVSVSGNQLTGIFVKSASSTAINIWHSWRGAANTWKKIFESTNLSIHADGIAAPVPHAYFTVIGSNLEITKIACNAWPKMATNTVPATGTIGETISLAAGTATDFESDTISYTWTQLSGPTSNISNANTANASFTPTEGGTYEIQLRLTDNGTPSLVAEEGETQTFSIVIPSPATPENQAPIANAGPDQTCALNQPCTLNGSGTDPEGSTLSFFWTRVTGPTLTWTTNTAATGVFTPTASGSYTLRLTVTDTNGARTSDTAIVTVAAVEPPSDNNNPPDNSNTPPPDNTQPPADEELPIITVPANQVGMTDQVVTLMIIVENPNNQPLTFFWRQLSGRLVSLNGSDLSNPSFAATESGSYSFEVRAKTPDGRFSEPQVVTLTINSPESNDQNSPPPGNLPNAPFTTETDALVWWVFGGLALILLLASGFYYWKKQQNQSKN